MKIDISSKDVDKLTSAGLKELVRQLLSADEGKEKEIMDRLAKKAMEPEKNDLADLHEEGHGKAPSIPVEDEDLPEGMKVPKKKGKK